MKRLLILPALLLIMQAVAAETIRYATDELTIAVRSGTSTGHKILELVPSGSPLTVLSEADNGYTQVRTPRGKEGWVLSRHLMTEPSARERLAQVEKRLATLGAENERLREDNRILDGTRGSLAECGEELEDIRQTAAKTLAIEEENLNLKQELNQRQGELESLRLQNLTLKDESDRSWFITGASVALGSLLLGLIIPRIPWRKRRRWDQF